MFGRGKPGAAGMTVGTIVGARFANRQVTAGAVLLRPLEDDLASVDVAGEDSIATDLRGSDSQTVGSHRRPVEQLLSERLFFLFGE